MVVPYVVRASCARQFTVNPTARTLTVQCEEHVVDMASNVDTREERLRRKRERDRARREMETPEEREARLVLNAPTIRHEVHQPTYACAS